MTSGTILEADMFQLINLRRIKSFKSHIRDYDPNQDSHKLIDALHDFRNSMSSKLKDAGAQITTTICDFD
jgi:hypothetical protein